MSCGDGVFSTLPASSASLWDGAGASSCMRVVGSLSGGLLGSWLGLRPALWIGTAGAMLGVLFLLPSPVLRLRELPEAPD